MTPRNTPPDDDLYVITFANLLATLPARAPITDEYISRRLNGRRSSWDSQREHMVGWFNGQDSLGFGAYSREVPNHSAKRCYNRLLSDFGLMWINEAMGVDPAKVQAAASAALQEPDHRRRCGLIRAHLPWGELIPIVFRKAS